MPKLIIEEDIVIGDIIIVGNKYRDFNGFGKIVKITEKTITCRKIGMTCTYDKPDEKDPHYCGTRMWIPNEDEDEGGHLFTIHKKKCRLESVTSYTEKYDNYSCH